MFQTMAFERVDCERHHGTGYSARTWSSAIEPKAFSFVRKSISQFASTARCFGCCAFGDCKRPKLEDRHFCGPSPAEGRARPGDLRTPGGPAASADGQSKQTAGLRASRTPARHGSGWAKPRPGPSGRIAATCSLPAAFLHEAWRFGEFRPLLEQPAQFARGCSAAGFIIYLIAVFARVPLRVSAAGPRTPFHTLRAKKRREGKMGHHLGLGQHESGGLAKSRSWTICEFPRHSETPFRELKAGRMGRRRRRTRTEDDGTKKKERRGPRWRADGWSPRAPFQLHWRPQAGD